MLGTGICNRGNGLRDFEECKMGTFDVWRVKRAAQMGFCILVCCNRIGFTIAARNFSRRRGESDEHIPQWICKERTTKSARKRTAALWVAFKLACGFVARRLQTHWRAMRPPRASPQANLGATNVIVFMLQTTKSK